MFHRFRQKVRLEKAELKQWAVPSLNLSRKSSLEVVYDLCRYECQRGSLRLLTSSVPEIARQLSTWTWFRSILANFISYIFLIDWFLSAKSLNTDDTMVHKLNKTCYDQVDSDLFQNAFMTSYVINLCCKEGFKSTQFKGLVSSFALKDFASVSNYLSKELCEDI